MSQGVLTLCEVQLSSIEVAVAAVHSEIDAADVASLSGPGAARLLTVVAGCISRLQTLQMNLSTHCVRTNQHGAAGAPSAASYLASLTGSSEKAVRAELALSRSLAELPEVAISLSSGEISMPKAAAIVMGSDADHLRARTLLALARHGSVEQVVYKAREMRARASVEDREITRRQQYMRLDRRADGLDRFEVVLLPELSSTISELYSRSLGSTSWQRAESFARLLSESGNGGAQIVAHLELKVDDAGRIDETGGSRGIFVGERSEIKGTGPVPSRSIMQLLEYGSLAFVGTVNNKLAFFSETDRRSTTKVLPEFIKRAVRRAAWDRCQTVGCTEFAGDVDHVRARVNGGTNDLSNLQALCPEHHRAKTRSDAPWTRGIIYDRVPKLQGGSADPDGAPRPAHSAGAGSPAGGGASGGAPNASGVGPARRLSTSEMSVDSKEASDACRPDRSTGKVVPGPPGSLQPHQTGSASDAHSPLDGFSPLADQFPDTG